jgi:hypothetical protein
MVALVLSASFVPTASATVVTLGLTFEYSGGADPAGPQAWATATFDDGGGTGSVKLVLAALNLTGAEFISNWGFNLDPALDPAKLKFSPPVKTGTYADPTISAAVDSFKAGPAHGFDIEFAFATKAADRFGAGESGEYTITGIATLTANSFKFLSGGGGGQGPFVTGAHVQGIADQGDGTSGWVTVPEPSTALTALIGFAGAVWLHRRRRNN